MASPVALPAPRGRGTVGSASSVPAGRGRALSLAAAALIGLALPAAGQNPAAHTTAPPPAPPLRASAILEWTGEPGKPNKSRLIPLAVFDGQDYQDGGLYLARPAPMALGAGTEYLLEQAGTLQSLYDVYDAENVQGAWYGYGVWRKAAPPKAPKLQKSKTPPVLVHDPIPDSDDHPHFAHRPDPQSQTQSGDQGKQSASQDSAKTGSTGTASPGNSSASGENDPDRPHLHRRPDSGSDTGTASGGSGDSGSSAASGKGASADDDPDRPTFHRHTSRAADAEASDANPISAGSSDDPDRPRLRRGKPTGELEEIVPEKLTDAEVLRGDQPIQQMAAISDAQMTDSHPYTFVWAKSDDAAKMQAAMEEIAKKAVNPTHNTAPANHGVARRTSASHAQTPASTALTDESFKAFELAYSGGATLVFSATSGDGPAKKSVTIIAQPDIYGTPRVLLQSVTDAAHLDVTPRMRLVDAADTDGDHRAELIFELRGAAGRQFAIYKIMRDTAEQVFATTTLP